MVAAAAPPGTRLLHRLSRSGELYVAKIEDGKSVEQKVAELQGHPGERSLHRLALSI